jgi:nucleoside-diphosphate-sugar epimerase
MESKEASGQIYHIGKEDEISMEMLTTYIGELMNYTEEYEAAVTYPGSVSRRCPDISKAANDFNYNPKIEWKKAVSLTVGWYKDFFTSGKLPKTGGFVPPENFIKRDN